MTRSHCLPALILFAFVVAASSAWAQSAGPDEAIGPNGAVTQKLALSPVQRRAIYNAAAQQRLRGSDRGIAVAIGAPVPPSVPLWNLPDQGAIDAAGTNFLKYAMVEDDLVVVDPIRMRVVDIIHPGAKP